MLFHKHARERAVCIVQAKDVAYDGNVILGFLTSDVVVLSSSGVGGFFIAGSIWLELPGLFIQGGLAAKRERAQ